MSKLHLQEFMDAGEVLATQAVTQHLATWISCDIADTACGEPFIASLGKRAFRRPLTAELQASLVGLYESGRAQWGATKGIELALQAMLSSPHFLYHFELDGGEPGDEVVMVDGYDMASRMSYFLWHTMPDDELLAL